MPELMIAGEIFRALIFFHRTGEKTAKIDRATKPANCRPKDTKSPGALMYRAKAPIPPINEAEMIFWTNPFALYLAREFIGYPQSGKCTVNGENVAREVRELPCLRGG